MQIYFRSIFFLTIFFNFSFLKSSLKLKKAIEQLKEKNKTDQKKIKEAKDSANKEIIKANLGKENSLNIKNITDNITQELEKKDTENSLDKKENLSDTNNVLNKNLKAPPIITINDIKIPNTIISNPEKEKIEQNSFQTTLENLNKEESLNKKNTKKKLFLTPKEKEKENLIIETFKKELEDPAANFGISYLDNNENKAEIIKDYLRSPKIQKILENMPKEKKEALLKKLKESFNRKISDLKSGNWTDLKLKKMFNDNSKNNSFKTEKNKNQNYFSFKEINKELIEEKKFEKKDSLKNEEEKFISKIFSSRNQTKKSNPSSSKTKKERVANLRKKLPKNEQKKLDKKLKEIENSLNETLSEFESITS